MTVQIDEIQTDLATLFVQDANSFASEVEQNFELLRELLMQGQGVNGTFVSADGSPQTIIVKNGIITGIS